MPFISKKIAEAYDNAPRFDEGHFYYEREFDELYRKYIDLDDEIACCFPPIQITLLERRLEFEREINELECRHYFEQGWLACRDSRKRES